jgi:hypothetical protein
VALFGAVLLPSAAAEQCARRGVEGGQGGIEAGSAGDATGTDALSQVPNVASRGGQHVKVLFGEGAAQSARLLLSGVGGTSKCTTMQAQAMARGEGLEVTRCFGTRSDALAPAAGAGHYNAQPPPCTPTAGILCTRLGDLMVGLCPAVSSLIQP